MKVAFNTSLEDTAAVYEALVLKQRENGQASKPWKLILITAGWMVFFTLIFWLLVEKPPYLLMVIFAVVIIVVVINAKFGLRKRLRKHLSKAHPEGQWIANITEINDAGVTHICQDNVTAFWWSQVSEIIREADYLRFYTRRSSVSQVPLRVFRTEEEIKLFEDEANRLWQAHKDEPPIQFPEISGIIEDELTAPGCVLINPALSPPPSESP